MSSEQTGIITKKCVATHINYFLNFKTALYSSALVMNLFNNFMAESCFKIIITVKLKASLLLNALLYICPLTLITEALHRVATVRCSFCSVPHYLSLFGRHSQYTVLLWLRPFILSTASVI